MNDMLNKLIAMARGKKTYIVAGLLTLWAWMGVALGQHDTAHAIELTLGALAATGLRSGLKSETIR